MISLPRFLQWSRNKPEATGLSPIAAATQLPSPPDPKVPSKQSVLPSFLKSAKPNPASAFPRDDRRLINTDITSYRNVGDTQATIRQFVKASPDLSAAVVSYVRTAITSGWTVSARNLDRTFNAEATSAVQQLITRFNVLNDYSIGYDDSMSIRSLCEAWLKDLLTYGAACGELVLNKARLPDKIQPVSSSQIRFYPSSDGKRQVPKQVISGQEISLDIPTFFWVGLDQDLLSPYPDSPLESALQPVLFSAEFMNDLRRIVKKALHPRTVVTIDYDKFTKSVPQDIKIDSEKLIAFQNETIANLEEQMNGLAPEDVLVVFDTLGIKIENGGNTNYSAEIEVLQGLADSKMSTGAKVLPTVLGHSDGTSNTASAETLMFIKYVDGAGREKLNELLSKHFTLAARLLGHDVYVEWVFKPIDLKPESELEAFEAMRQSRILDQLSLGLITDEQACLLLTGSLPPAGAPRLSGTMFRAGAGTATPVGDGYNGASNSGSTMNQNLAPTTPTGTRGSNRRAEIHALPAVK